MQQTFNLGTRLGTGRLADVQVPVARPNNYYRSLFHVASGLVALVCIQFLVPPAGLIWIAAGFAGYSWSMETLRRIYPAFNQRLMRFYGRIAHPHEHHQVNSATWYATALLLLALLASPMTCSLAVLVLAIGDPAAGIIGRRYGRIKIRQGRSLEGSLAFVAAAGLAVFGVLQACYPALGWHVSLVYALTSAVAGALAEINSRRLDDNLTVPLAVGLAATLTGLLVG